MSTQYQNQQTSRFHLVKHEVRAIPSLGECVVEGLVNGVALNGTRDAKQKSLSCQFFYDAKGSQLFEQITELDEYYLTKAEDSILKEKVSEIVNSFGDSTEEIIITELGSGSSTKTRTILEAFLKRQPNLTYVPIDISDSILTETATDLTGRYPSLNVVANHGLYQQGLQYCSQSFKNSRKLVCFLGSSLGNFKRDDAAKFLKEVRQTMTHKDKLLLGLDLKKDKNVLERAYDDSKGVTAAFNMNLLERINNELGGTFDLTKFVHVALYNEQEGRIEMRIRATESQDVFVEALGQTIHFDKDETIHTENSYKYSPLEIDSLATQAGFYIEQMFTDKGKRFSLSILTPIPQEQDPTGNILQSILSQQAVKEVMTSAWKCSDTVFSLITDESFMQRPILLRHPFIFYLGHLAAFANNHIMNNCLEVQPSVNAYFDEIFERGIDPNVVATLSGNDKNETHSKSKSFSLWPSKEEVEKYRQDVRNRILSYLDQAARLTDSDKVMAQKFRAYFMVAEHDLMHAETLLYMYHNLDRSYKNIPSEVFKNYIIAKSPVAKGKMIDIPSGYATIGTNHHSLPWGWDNEFPQHEVLVKDFKMSELPVTNGEFLEFVTSGEYENPSNWTPSDWQWKELANLKFPNTWEMHDGKFFYRTVFDLIPLDEVADWPVYVSQAEATAYAKSKGMRLPTEAEFCRAAYGRRAASETASLKHPWGVVATDKPWGVVSKDQEPIKGVHGNFGFWSWAPTPVGYFPSGKSEFGIYELVGNGFEWTSTIFDGLPGFQSFVPKYEGYSKDFFDGEHYVCLGASWATAEPLVRASFRNWYQSHYQYTFTKFRCVSDCN